MAMLQLGQDRFSVGRAPFHDSHPGGDEASARVYIEVTVEGMEEPFLALLDTGASWSVIDREIAEEAGLIKAEGHDLRISHRNGTTDGRLVRTTMELVAEEGSALVVQATVFVPDENLPPPVNFIGYSGFLERIRLGLDPQKRDVYFGGYDSETAVED